ncbi:MAG TPA: hypothetical protein VGN07_16085 [Steroidobacteraceae bacterium]|jgi:hypothetical protein
MAAVRDGAKIVDVPAYEAVEFDPATGGSFQSWMSGLSDLRGEGHRSFLPRREVIVAMGVIEILLCEYNRCTTRLFVANFWEVILNDSVNTGNLQIHLALGKQGENVGFFGKQGTRSEGVRCAHDRQERPRYLLLWQQVLRRTVATMSQLATGRVVEARCILYRLFRVHAVAAPVAQRSK